MCVRLKVGDARAATATAAAAAAAAAAGAAGARGVGAWRSARGAVSMPGALVSHSPALIQNVAT